ncbi:hypothetical protein BDA96_10G113100 [Sorghum bicolor]|uniref:Uncharacterized protein n=1 Tax=Sorghum bicolor TaxID=4558 RepID=A0A921Q3L2_SORBI|nr:hypothetical protein BDA96_10G113100 [Sorghum bicolor]
MPTGVRTPVVRGGLGVGTRERGLPRRHLAFGTPRGPGTVTSLRIPLPARGHEWVTHGAGRCTGHQQAASVEGRFPGDPAVQCTHGRS